MFKRSMWLMATLLLVIVTAAFAGVTILAPVNGASVSSNDLILIGKTSKTVKEVEIKGITNDGLKVKVNKGGFFTKVKLLSNDNDITILADDGSTAKINIKVNGSEKFNYHPDESEVLDCTTTCHGSFDTVGYVAKPVAAVCYECHDANNDKAFVHGPVNMGVCEVCHMPHGSSNASFLMVGKEALCSGCHDGLMSTHPDTGNKICIDCHDPHSSDKEFHMK